MSPEEAARYDSYWYDVGTQKAIEARDAALSDISKWSNTRRNDIVAVVGAVDLDTGNVAVGIKSAKMHRGIYANGQYLCAEDLALQQLGKNKSSIIFTEAVRPRGNKTIPVCIKCQQNYSKYQFIIGVLFDE